MPEKKNKKIKTKTYSKYSIEDFKVAIKNSNGNKSLVRRRLNCSSQTVYVYLNKYPELKKLLEIEKDYYKEDLLDIARVKLYKDVLAGKPYAISLAIRTLGKSEGFAQRQELTTPERKKAPFDLTVNFKTDDTPLRAREEV